MDKVFKSSDATRDAARMQRIVQKLQAEYRGESGSGSDRTSPSSEVKGEFVEKDQV